MANSIFLNASGNSSGGVQNFSQPLGAPDGVINAPGWTWANAPTDGWYRSGTGIFSLSLNGYSATVPMAQLSQGVGFVLGGNIGLGFVAAGGAGSAPTTFIRSVGNGLLNLSSTTAETVGVGLNLLTDAVLLLRTRAQTGYATLDCLGLKASGTAGANFGPSAVASLTVVNGIVTAAS